MLMILLPTASWLPANLIFQFRLASEEEVESHGVTLGATTEVRRKIVRLPKGRRLPLSQEASSRLHLAPWHSADHSEFRFVNGTGALLRC